MNIEEGLTFDDVMLIPNYSEVLPVDADLTSNISKNIRINLPFVSAAMDTVTDARMAIEIANLGGVGILHRNQSPQDQINEIKKVKRFESCFINNPVTLSPEDTVKKARELVRTLSFSGFPIVENGNKLAGIVTKRDLRASITDETPLKEIMTKKVTTAQEGVALTEAKKIMESNKIEKLPIINSKNQLVCLVTLKDILSQSLKPKAAKDSVGRLLIGAAVGAGDIERAVEAEKAGADFLAIDSAHGYTKNVIEMLKNVKKKVHIDIICGNIVEDDAAKALIENGASAVKVGVGPGSICTTRIVAGVGVPQFSAICKVSKITSKSSIPLIADGGIRYSGDITKALSAGASCVMLGSLLAGCEEAPGERIIYKGRSYKVYRGMGSLGAVGNYTKDRYNISGKTVPEGVEGMVPLRGPLKDLLYQLEGGVRAGMGYAGCKTINELWAKARFVRITIAGLRESHPHDVIVTKEAPNYFIEKSDQDTSTI
ncbi:MAG: IMP dehydrogenase [Planctomycetes bacterium]|nr:IMP dehydrogenase [Planctomycetota bacterium]